MRRETASKASPTSLLLSYREMSTITSTKSTRISTTPNTLSENDAKAVSRCSRDQENKSSKKHTHRNPKDMTTGVIFFRTLLQTEAVCGDALGFDGVSICRSSVWTYWYAVSGTTLSSFPSSIFTSASSIFATFLTERERVYAATVHLQSLSFSISHPFTPKSEPGLKYTEDMVHLPFSSLRSELGISVLRAKSTTSLQKVNRSVLHNHFTVSTLQKKKP